MTFPNLKDAKTVSIDLETRDPDLLSLGPGPRRDGYIAGIAVAVSPKDSWYFPIGHEVGKNLDKEQVFAWCKDNLTTPGQVTVGANLLYDLDFLQEVGVDIPEPFYDILFAEPLIDENQYKYNLESVSQKYLGEGKDEGELWKWAKDNIGGHITEKVVKSNIWRMPGNLVAKYAKADTTLPLQVMGHQEKILQLENLTELSQMEHDLIPLLLAMRRKGVKVDIGKSEEVSGELGDRIKELQQELNETAGFEVNTNAGASLAKLFDNMNLGYNRTAKGNPSFTAPFFESLNHPVGQIIRNLKKYTKAKDTFVDGYINKFQLDSRVHCLFHPLKTGNEGTVSGRFSSTLPNLQNIPARDPYLGPLIRSMFIPEEGEDWIKMDYSQIEPRIMLHYAQGMVAEDLRRAYALDPTLDCYDSMLQSMPSLGRKKVKTIYLGASYGMGQKKMAEQLGMSLKEAEPFFEDFHKGAPYVKEMAYKTSDRARSRGCIRTLMHRRARFNQWTSSDWKSTQEARKLGLKTIFDSKKEAQETFPRHRLQRANTHKALNRLIQGGAADVMKKAMVDVWKSGVCDVLGAPLLTVHDELDFSVPRTKQALEAMQEAKRIMEQTVNLKVPLLVDIERGPDWGNVE